MSASQAPSSAASLPRLGMIGPHDQPTQEPWTSALLQALSDLGWVDGQTIVIKSRFADDNQTTLPALVGDLLSSGVDVIWASTTAVATAAHMATTTVPIVMAFVGDPVRSGLVASLQQPGGNVTGITANPPGISSKQLLLLRELAPDSTRVA